MKQLTKYLVSIVFVAVVTSLTIAGQEVKDTTLSPINVTIGTFDLPDDVRRIGLSYGTYRDNSTIEYCIHYYYEDNETVICENTTRRISISNDSPYDNLAFYLYPFGLIPKNCGEDCRKDIKKTIKEKGT